MKTISRNTWTDSDGEEHINDIYLDGNGQFAMCDGAEKYKQILEAVILVRKGEMYFDTESGVPYFETIFNNPNSILIWKTYVQDAVSAFSFVSKIKSFEVEYLPSSHQLNYELVVVTKDEDEITISN